jgi:hypothetical protein
VEHARVRVGDRSPPTRGNAPEQQAEHALGVRRADGFETRVGVLVELGHEAPRVPDHPVAAAPRLHERLCVRVGVGAPGRSAYVQHEERRLEVLPRLHQLAADAPSRRGRLLEDGGRRLARRVVAEAPAVGERLAVGQATHVEGRSQLALEAHREKVRHCAPYAGRRAPVRQSRTGQARPARCISPRGPGVPRAGRERRASDVRRREAADAVSARRVRRSAPVSIEVALTASPRPPRSAARAPETLQKR